MKPEKLKIIPEEGDEIEVLFNPNKIKIDKSFQWRSTPKPQSDVSQPQPTHGDAATLTIDELFFDTYETRSNVRDRTDRLFQLTVVNGELHRPPIVTLQWGTWTFDDFQWVLQRFSQSFTLFLDDGTPVRATLNCVFKQWISNQEEAQRQNKQSSDVPKTHTVKRGETLSSIAGKEFKDPTRWRAIARANDIDNPRRLEPGRILAIPTLNQSRRSTR
ncbi:LysM peptidoglycan-binding domain-containing protein [Geitlerinema sp. CS-897]|nr:LysM peptidoglycan-binding domain-containing protein [Geitlerinema sp. CS-897]